jgi:predicted nucleic acid-binding protein
VTGSAGDVFFDTSGLLAVLRDRDALHSRAAAVLGALHRSATRAVTSDWVLSELLAATSSPGARRSAAAFVRNLAAQPTVTIEPATRAGWQDAFALYEKRPDKGWSLVDCTSILICRARGIRRVFAHDHEFEQAGLQILLP